MHPQLCTSSRNFLADKMSISVEEWSALQQQFLDVKQQLYEAKDKEEKAKKGASIVIPDCCCSHVL